MKYRLCAFSEGVKWLQDQWGVYWVNPQFLDEFMQTYNTGEYEK